MHAANPFPPSPDGVTRISAMTDPIARNRQITQAYHDLAVAVAHLLPGGANWCAVATWASRQAGQTIRREDLRRTFERLLRDSAAVEAAAGELAAGAGGPESLAGAAQALREALSPAAAFERTADAVARGNRKVFAEIGLAFARYLSLFDDGPPDGRPPDAAALATFYDSLRPGDPPDGQGLLRRAFAHYTAALSAEGKARAELLLLANLEVGFHEQTRLQPEIRAAMDAPIYEPAALRRRLLDELFPDPGARLRLAVLRLGGEAAPLLAARDRLADEAQRLGRRAITAALMTLELPRGRVLRLGHDLTATFPPALRTLGNPDLRALLAGVDATPDSPRGTGGRDWSELPGRMHFIADLFRAYHEDGSLYDSPFAEEESTDYTGFTD
jgi:hypothetical protein